MRAYEEQEVVLPAVRAAFASTRSLGDARSALVQALPPGWSITDIASPDQGHALLVECDGHDGCLGFLLSEEAGLLDLHALVDERLILLGRRCLGARVVVTGARAA